MFEHEYPFLKKFLFCYFFLKKKENQTNKIQSKKNVTLLESLKNPNNPSKKAGK